MYKPTCGDRVRVEVDGDNGPKGGTVLLNCKDGQCEGPGWSLIVNYGSNSSSSASPASPVTTDDNLPCIGLTGNLKSVASNVSVTFELKRTQQEGDWGGISMINFCTNEPHTVVPLGYLAPPLRDENSSTSSPILLGDTPPSSSNTTPGNGSNSSSPAVDSGLLARPMTCDSTDIGLNLTDAAILQALPITALESRGIHSDLKDAHNISDHDNNNSSNNNANENNSPVTTTEDDGSTAKGTNETGNDGSSIRISMGSKTGQVDIICTARITSAE